MVNASSALYQIFLYDLESFSGTDQQQSFSLLDQKELETIVDELKIKRYKDYATEFSVHISNQTKSTDWVVLIDNLNQLENLYERLKVYNNVYGSILEFRFEEAPEAELDLIQRLIDQGTRKAQQISRLAGKEIGDLLSLEEEHTDAGQSPTADSTTGWTFYPPLSALPNEASKPSKARTTIRKRVKLRFAWK
ncbi:MAG: hypothetical protein KTR30_24060 [Saprospiraceae bacterium]|nr:hypothetical protein [Saprospiraceae bacterium]